MLIDWSCCQLAEEGRAERRYDDCSRHHSPNALKVVESGVPPFSTTLYSFLFGGLIIACLFVYDAGSLCVRLRMRACVIDAAVNFDFSRLVESWETLPAIAYCGVIAMTITYSVQLWALMRTSPTVAGCYSVLQPPMAALVGIVVRMSGCA
jgi:drug/metabolite transporter (DMT)-like permease